MAAWVARQHQPPATSMMARVDRLDLVLCYLEEMMQQQHHRNSRSTASTCSPSTPTTTAAAGLMSDDDDDSAASAASTPRGVGVGGSKSSLSWRRGSSCRPAKEALEEARAKGSLVHRIAFLEDRVLKMEEDMEIITPEKQTTMSHGHDARKDKADRSRSSSSSNNKKGLKSLVKSCVRGKLRTKD